MGALNLSARARPWFEAGMPDATGRAPGLAHPAFMLAPVLIGALALYLPTYLDLADVLPGAAGQGHELIILGVSLWLAWRQRRPLAALPVRPLARGWPLMLLGLALYVLGRSQDILLFEVGSQILVFASLLLLLSGVAALRLLSFPLLYLIFMVPLPGPLVDAVTLPMKSGVSMAVEHVLAGAGYPISRSGVVLQIGQYQLLVADACAGLHTLFTLEALGVLYMHLVRHTSVVRNILLAAWIVPISFSANVIRVLVLTLITYHFGDEAGQGFMHGFAGMVLFVSALLLIMGIDNALQWFVALRRPATRMAA